MAFRKLVGSYKDYNLATTVIEDGYLVVDVDTGSLALGDGVTPGGKPLGPKAALTSALSLASLLPVSAALIAAPDVKPPSASNES